MKKPVLVIMAAGMGSRYGGLKQIDPIDSDGHIIIDFSIYDAVRAGFEKVIFIIKRENEQIFRETISSDPIDGLHTFVSHKWIVLVLTPRRSASSCCVILFLTRYDFNE